MPGKLRVAEQSGENEPWYRLNLGQIKSQIGLSAINGTTCVCMKSRRARVRANNRESRFLIRGAQARLAAPCKNKFTIA